MPGDGLVPGFFMPGSLVTSHKWVSTGKNGYVQHNGLFGKPRMLKEGMCITQGGLFGKPRFVKTVTPTASPHCTPVMRATDGEVVPRMDLK